MASNQGIPIGSVPEVTASFKVNESLEDPTSVVATVESPTGTESNPTATRLAKGVYLVAFTVTEPGLWHYRITGDAPAEGAVEGDLLVADSQVLDAYPAADYTYDLTTDIGKVRLYIDDRDFSRVSASLPRGQRSAIFDDAEIQTFIDVEGGAYDAASVALVAIATNKNLLVQRRELDGANVDFGTLRKDLLDMAQRYRDLSDGLDGGVTKPASATAEVNHGEFSERDIIINSWLRQSI